MWVHRSRCLVCMLGHHVKVKPLYTLLAIADSNCYSDFVRVVQDAMLLTLNSCWDSGSNTDHTTTIFNFYDLLHHYASQYVTNVNREGNTFLVSFCLCVLCYE